MNGEENNNYSGDISPEIVNIKPPVTPESVLANEGSMSNVGANTGMNMNSSSAPVTNVNTATDMNHSGYPTNTSYPANPVPPMGDSSMINNGMFTGTSTGNQLGMNPNPGMGNTGTMGMDSNGYMMNNGMMGSTMMPQDGGTKKSKKWLIPVILGVVILFLLVAGLTYQMIMSSPKRIFESSINSLYKEINTYLNEMEKYTDSYDMLNKAVLLKGDITFDTNIAEAKELGINFGDFTLGGEVGIDIPNELMQGSAFIKGKSEKVDVQVYLQDDSMYGASNLIDGMLKSEYGDLSEEFKKIRKYVEEYQNESVTIEDLDYIVKTFKDALIETLDSEKMSKEKASISVLGKEVKVTKYSYTMDGHDALEMLESINETLLNDDEFIDKLAKLIGEDKEDVKDTLKEMTEESTFEDDDLDEVASFHIYTSGFANVVTGIGVEYDDKEQFHYYVDGKNFDIYDYDDTYEEKIEEVKITGEFTDDVYDVKIVVNDEEFGSLKVREISRNVIDLDYDFKEDGYKGTLYINSKEETEAIYGSYKFRMEHEGEFISFEGTYGIEFKDKLEKVNPSKVITSEAEVDKEVVRKRIDEILEKDEAFKKLYEKINEEIVKSQLNQYGMIPIQSIHELKNVIEQKDKAIVYVGMPNTSIKSTNELEVLNSLKSIQDKYGFKSYYYDYTVLPAEFEQLTNNVIVTCVVSGYSGDLDIPMNCMPATNCMPVCLEYPVIYFVKDGKIVSGIRGEVRINDIMDEIQKNDFNWKIVLDQDKEDI